MALHLKKKQFNGRKSAAKKKTNQMETCVRHWDVALFWTASCTSSERLGRSSIPHTDREALAHLKSTPYELNMIANAAHFRMDRTERRRPTCRRRSSPARRSINPWKMIDPSRSSRSLDIRLIPLSFKFRLSSAFEASRRMIEEALWKRLR